VRVDGSKIGIPLSLGLSDIEVLGRATEQRYLDPRQTHVAYVRGVNYILNPFRADWVPANGRWYPGAIHNDDQTTGDHKRWTGKQERSEQRRRISRVGETLHQGEAAGMIVNIIQGLASFAALVSGYFWLRAALIKTPKLHKRVQDFDDLYKVGLAVSEQAQWNSYAAFSATLAAFLAFTAWLWGHWHFDGTTTSSRTCVLL
jgi:hypothetical protein